MNKMYILILEDVPIGHAINSACHAAVACTLKYADTDEVKAWLNGPFKKVACKVSQAEFDKAIEVEEDYSIIRESSLDNKLTAVAFKPREEYHKAFKFFKLYR